MPARAFLILLVEDNELDAQLFLNLCGESNPDILVQHVFNGQEALDYLERSAVDPAADPRPDLILLDLNMPVMDGHAFLEEAKEHDNFRRIPVIALTSSERPGDIQRSYHNFANGYLIKPSTFEDMQALLQVLVSYWQGAVRLPRLGDL